MIEINYINLGIGIVIGIILAFIIIKISSKRKQKQEVKDVKDILLGIREAHVNLVDIQNDIFTRLNKVNKVLKEMYSFFAMTNKNLKKLS